MKVNEKKIEAQESICFHKRVMEKLVVKISG
jgi:hypothetical protein